MKHLLLLFVLIAFSCKKEDEKPESKTGRLEIEYKTLDTEMNTWYNIGNILVENSPKDTNYFKLDVVTKGGQTYNVSIAPINGGYTSSILIKFNGDTIAYKSDGNFGLSGTLPFIK